MLRPPRGGPHGGMGYMTPSVKLGLTTSKVNWHKTHRCAKVGGGLQVIESANYEVTQV
jgi:hypothetical protein